MNVFCSNEECRKRDECQRGDDPPKGKRNYAFKKFEIVNGLCASFVCRHSYTIKYPSLHKQVCHYCGYEMPYRNVIQHQR